MNYRRNKKILLLVLFGICAFFCYYIFFSPSAIKARKNIQNLKNIEIGMNKEDVLTIMGTPENRRISFLNITDSMYYYIPPFGASEGIYIQFNDKGKVNKIIEYE